MNCKIILSAVVSAALTACSQSETANAPVAEPPAAATTKAEMASNQITGTIVRFECGDNCYLVIKPKTGEEVSGLCIAETCKPWNEAVAIPENLIGRTVTVTTGMDKQLDGSGNVMGEFLSFKTVVIAG